MADRTSASLFARIFRFLAEQPDDRSKSFAKVLSEMTSEYDFNTYQMSCDEELEKLGLARWSTEEEMRKSGNTERYLILFDDEDFHFPNKE